MSCNGIQKDALPSRGEKIVPREFTDIKLAGPYGNSGQVPGPARRTASSAGCRHVLVQFK